MDKRQLRLELKIKRAKLESGEVHKLSRQIIDNLWNILSWTEIYSIHSYLPITINNEVDTLSFITAVRQQHPSINIASWDTTGEDAKSRWINDNLRPTKLVPESFQYDLIVVPLLGFDERGHRLGYGGGFYDKFLADQDHALTVGLCYNFGLVKKLEDEQHDKPIKLIVTEKQIYSF